MVDIEDFPKSAIDVPREIYDPPRSDVAKKHLRNVRSRNLREHFLHREIRVRRYMRERWLLETRFRRHLEPPYAVNNPWCLFQSDEQGMSGSCVVLKS